MPRAVLQARCIGNQRAAIQDSGDSSGLGTNQSDNTYIQRYATHQHVLHLHRNGVLPPDDKRVRLRVAWRAMPWSLLQAHSQQHEGANLQDCVSGYPEPHLHAASLSLSCEESLNRNSAPNQKWRFGNKITAGHMPGCYFVCNLGSSYAALVSAPEISGVG
jgi:hypothetical protein